MKYVAVLICIIALLLLFFGAKFLFYTFQFKKKAVKTIGTIIEVRTSTGRTTSITYSPVVEFFTMDGEKQIYDVSRFNYTKYKIGDKIEIVYSKQNPKKVSVDNFYNIFIPPIVVLSLGIICMLTALIIYFKYRS